MANYWSEFRHQGQAISLEHLNPFEFRCGVPGEVERRVFVTFDEHTFTRKIEAHDPIDQVCFRNRIFCGTRYDLSQSLPEKILTFPRIRVTETWERSGYVYFAGDVVSPAGPYHIFFDVKRHQHSKKHKGVKMHVLSAYPREKGVYGEGQKTNTIDFSRLIENTYMNRPLNFSR